MTKRNKLVALLCVISLQGCALAPGMHMANLPTTPDAKVPSSNEASWTEPESDVTITPITADLIARKIEERRLMAGHLPLPQDEPYRYRIGPRDILSITVWEHPELTIPAGEFRSAEAAGHLVGEDGKLFYPYIGVLDVAGMTVGQLRGVLTQRLAKYIENPQLEVRVAAYRSQKAYIVGQVLTPGIQPLTDVPLTVVEAINLRGGVTTDANMSNVTLSRNGQIYPIDLLSLYEQGDVAQNLLLHDGDVLNVPDRNQSKVFVMGEVGRQSSLTITKSRMTLAEALSDADGINPATADPSRIYVIRNGEQDDREIFHLDGKSPDAMLLANRFELKSHDMVYVDTAAVTRWNRVISQLLPSSQLVQSSSDARRSWRQ